MAMRQQELEAHSIDGSASTDCISEAEVRPSGRDSEKLAVG